MKRSKAGFTLIELMIVVAIIGILAAIAIPNFVRFQLRAKASEGKTNLKGIAVAQESYRAEFDVYIPAAAEPLILPGRVKTRWGLVDCSGADMMHGFCITGWSPEGEVFYQYQVVATDIDGNGTADVYTADARSDIDGDVANINLWGLVKGTNSTGVNAVPGGFGCPAAGVWDVVTASNRIFDVVGPCDSVSGRSVF
jgi:type IV pilus assembly protein PilA